MTLRSLILQPVYDSADHDLIRDLIVPLLSHAREYYRGVGFFSSGWLRLASQGIVRLIENGGTARLIMSPMLDERDWEAIQRGEQARRDEELRRLLSRQVEDISSSLEKDTRNCFAWLICDGVLELKFAVPRLGHCEGDYHDKVAFFRDEDGDTVAIHGSFNDSVKGSLNGEAFSVFRSWDPGHEGFVQQHVSRLVKLWNDENGQFMAVPLPDAVKAQIIELRTTPDRPYVLPAAVTTDTIVPSEPHIPCELHDYQRDAIESWCAAGCQGILEMATGTGKTFTSLAAAAGQYARRKRLACVILVPYLHLMEQWKEHCVSFGFYPILCSGSHRGWHAKAREAIADFRMGTPHLCLIAVHDTASSEGFAEVCEALPSESLCLIADEAHALGAPSRRTALLPRASMRLALTATPRRWFDDEGTAFLMDYFRGVCFEYTLEQAIGRFLVPYSYHPILVTLTDEEELAAKILTSRIGAIPKESDDPKDAETLKHLLLERARIVAGASSKNAALDAAVRGLLGEFRMQGRPPKDILIYCAAGKHKDVLRSVADTGLSCHEFVHSVDIQSRSRILREFSDGMIQALIAIKCLDEGVDVPSTRFAFFMASTSNPREFIQRRGRVLRMATGKDMARLYDFVVVPSATTDSQVAGFLLRRDMPRFAEFASCANNKYEARQVVRHILDEYQMLHLLDMTPWEVYREAKVTRSTIEGD